MIVVLGVDAGASKTLALVADGEGHTLGLGQGGAANHQIVGLDAAVDEIRRSCEDALAAAGASAPVDAGLFGLAGADLPVDFAVLTPAMRTLGLAAQISVKNDTMVALRGGSERGWGVAVICGTGFNAGGIGPDGQEIRLPGLGALSGDWGGGSDITQEVVRLISRAWDGRGRPTALTGLVLDALGIPSMDKLIAQVYESRVEAHSGHFDERRLLAIVPLVFEAAYGGDEVAQELVIRLGKETGTTANALIRRLGVETSDVEVVLAGGVFKGEGPLLMDTVTQVVHQVAPKARIVRPLHEPVVGAVMLALESLGIEVDAGVRGNLRASLPELLR